MFTRGNNELKDVISKMPLATLISYCDIFDRYLDIRIKQYRNWVKVNALIYLLNREESCTPSTLAKLMLRSRTGITDLMNNLEKDGLIKRIHSDKDRRSITIKVTSKGIKYVFARINKLPPIEDKIKTYLSDEELSTLVKITRKLKFEMVEDIIGSEYPRPKNNKS
jgi:DNA-binding MarR family transcriptional regulator